MIEEMAGGGGVGGVGARVSSHLYIPPACVSLTRAGNTVILLFLNEQRAISGCYAEMTRDDQRCRFQVFLAGEYDSVKENLTEIPSTNALVGASYECM